MNMVRVYLLESNECLAVTVHDSVDGPDQVPLPVPGASFTPLKKLMEPASEPSTRFSFLELSFQEAATNPIPKPGKERYRPPVFIS